MFKKIRTVCCMLIAAVLLCSCSLIMTDTKPVESPLPQTVKRVELKKPDGQSDALLPCIAVSETEEIPIRPLENAEKIRGEYVRSEVVDTENDLILAVMKLRKPVFYRNSKLRLLYNRVLEVLNTIISNDMTDYERVHSIYDYLSYYTIYDFDLLERFTEDEDLVENSDPAFGLEGVFYNHLAVCDGFSKAFSLMCGIEGIESVRIAGEAGEDKLPHAWNKVKLDGVWYCVDTTNASLALSKGEDNVIEYLNHAYFLIGDEELGFTETDVFSGIANIKLDDVKSADAYGYYEKEYIDGYMVSKIESLSIKKVPHNYVFETKSSLSLYLNYIEDNEIKAAEVYSELSQTEIMQCIALELGINTSVKKILGNVYYIII